MKYEKPKVEIIRFDAHDLFMAYSSNSHCDIYDGTYCTVHSTGEGICNYFNGSYCANYNYSDHQCQDIGYGWCGVIDGDASRPFSCSFGCAVFP